MNYHDVNYRVECKCWANVAHTLRHPRGMYGGVYALGHWLSCILFDSYLPGYQFCGFAGCFIYTGNSTEFFVLFTKKVTRA